LKKLKEKLKVQRQHLDELDEHIKELEKESGGEQH
jgi:ATPase inhibitor, mitochondrial